MNILLSFLLLIILIHLTTSKAFRTKQVARKVSYTTRRPFTCFTPCPPPKFDVFLESILGTWSVMNPNRLSDSDSNLEPTITTSTVEEVMRSCGGAVQGVKEIAYPNSPFDRMYHNRADDGFLFFDCGSYISGPTSIGSISSNAISSDDGSSLVASLSLTTTQDEEAKRCRVVISTTPKMNVLLTKVSSTMRNVGTACNVSELELHTKCPLGSTATCNNKIQWQEEILCKMSSQTQPWMLQRAKWEKYTQNKGDMVESATCVDESSSSESSSTEQSKASSSFCWIDSSNFTFDEQHKITCHSEAFKSFSGTNNDIAYAIQIGAIVERNVKAFLQCYNSEGRLRGVIFQSGKLRVAEED